MMAYCYKCGAQLSEMAAYCGQCGAKCFSGENNRSNFTADSRVEDNTIRRIADYERISGILWMILGIIQIFTLFGAIAGIWNVFAARSRLKLAPQIRLRDSRVPDCYKGIGQLIVIGIINLFLGGAIGLAFVIFDFYIRDKVLSNSWLFTVVPENYESDIRSKRDIIG